MGAVLAARALPALRVVAAAMIVLGVLIGGVRSAVAQGGASGVDGNRYEGDDFAWSIEWDEDIWTEPQEVDSKDADMLQITLVTEEGDIIGAVTLLAFSSFSGDPERCAERYGENVLAERGPVDDVAEASEVEMPRAPRGQANAAYSYTMEFEDEPLELIDYVQCRTLVEGDAVLTAWITVLPAGYELAIEPFMDLLEAVEVEEAAAVAVSGIDGNTYESPTYGFTLEWDDELWEVDAEEEVAGAGHEQIDQVSLFGEASYLTIEARAGYEGDARDCLDAQIEAMETDPGLVDAEPMEDRRGDPVEGRTEAGGRYIAYVLTFEDEDGDEEDRVQHFECRTLEDGQSVLILSLFTYPDEYEDELEAAEEIFETIEV